MRRGIEYATDPPELDKIHLIWDRWLHNIRKDTPTSEDLVNYERHLERMKIKIQEVEEKDRLMKLEEERIERETGSMCLFLYFYYFHFSCYRHLLHIPIFFIIFSYTHLIIIQLCN